MELYQFRKDVGRIMEYISSQAVATVCCADYAGNPYCFNCFYLFHPGNQFLIYKSSPRSRHSRYLEVNPLVAGTILPRVVRVSTVIGVQFSGRLLDIKGYQKTSLMRLYRRAYPYSSGIGGAVYVIKIEKIKMTDNSRGFAHKFCWSAPVPTDGFNH